MDAIKKIPEYFAHFDYRGFCLTLLNILKYVFFVVKVEILSIRKEYEEKGFLNAVLARKKTVAALIFSLLIMFTWFSTPSVERIEMPIARVERKNFSVDIKTVGELEAAKSTIIASSVKGDQGKIIFLVPDGVNVKEKEVVVRMDPTPFEEKLEQANSKLKEQESYIKNQQKALEWEISQAENEMRSVEFEIEASELELFKLTNGDGPLETNRLKNAMQKAKASYEEMSSYSEDLAELEAEGFLNPTELRNAKKKLNDELENYESAKLQYDNYTTNVYPMLLKKAEASLKQSKIKKEETYKSRGYAIGKAMAEIEQSKQMLEECQMQVRQGEKELLDTEIYAPSSGMVVHREDFRGGQRRKPRLGDIVLRNQPIMDLPDLDSMIVKSKVREVDLCKIAVGKKVSIEVDAYPHLLFSGTLSSIGVLALSDIGRTSEEKYFEIRVNLDKNDSRMRPGMTTRVVIHADEAKDALVIPVHAIFQEQKNNYCYVYSWSTYEKREIEVGLHNEEWAEIKKGLKIGENVCLIQPIDL